MYLFTNMCKQLLTERCVQIYRGCSFGRSQGQIVIASQTWKISHGEKLDSCPTPLLTPLKGEIYYEAVKHNSYDM